MDTSTGSFRQKVIEWSVIFVVAILVLMATAQKIRSVGTQPIVISANR